MLVDTEQTLTLVSRELYTKMRELKAIDLQPVDQNIIVAYGEPLTVDRKIPLRLELIIEYYAVVGSINLGCIVGLGLLKACGSIIDLSKSKLSISGESFDMILEGNIGYYSVSAGHR